MGRRRGRKQRSRLTPLPIQARLVLPERHEQPEAQPGRGQQHDGDQEHFAGRLHAPLAVVGDGYAPYAPWVGLILFVGLVWLSYRRTRAMVVATA